MSTPRIAELIGSISQPEVALTFERSDKHAITGESLLNWVRALPGRRWDGPNRRWIVTACGSNPDAVIKAAGFELILDGDNKHASLDDVFSLAELIPPLVKRSTARPAIALVRCRMSGFVRTADLLGPGAIWDKEKSRFEIRLADLVDTSNGSKTLDKRMEFAGDTAERAIYATTVEAPTDANLSQAAAATALSTGIELTDSQNRAVQKLIDEVGDIPDWFGMDLYPYQRLGAIAAATGRGIIADSPGLGKGSPTWVKILTPNGWTTYGDVKVGQQVVGSNGKPTTVIGVFPRGELEVFTVTMNDGSSVVVDGDHLWAVKSTNARQIAAHSRTLSTRELMEGLERNDSNLAFTSFTHFIPMVDPVQFAKQKKLPLDPYVLGVVIGNGQITPTGATLFVSADIQIADEFSARLPAGVEMTLWDTPPDRHPVYSTAKSDGLINNPLTEILRDLDLPGTRAGTKFIPEQYLFATPDERLDLLRGLFDTVGHVGALLEYVTVSPQLADGVKFLVQSLGGQVCIETKNHHYKDGNGAKRAGKTVYQVVVIMPAHLNPFLLERKHQAWKKQFKYGPMRNIRSIEPAGREDVICIAVDAQDQLYVTEDFIVTHNTRQALATACMKDARRTLIIVPPVVVTHWGREVDESNLASNCSGDIVIFHAKKKEPSLPERGVVIIPDSLLVSRPVLARDLNNWSPDFLIYDEAHRARNWTSKRSKTVRSMIDALDEGTPRLMLTGTPIFATPQELAPLLAMTGHLDPVFGGYSNFLRMYCRQNKYKAWVPIKRMLPQLKQMLDDHVWVRRIKADVLKDLPQKSRVGQFVDVDLVDYHRAHNDVVDKLVIYLTDFYKEFGRFPTDEENTGWANKQIGIISPLRKAAGVAKVPHALELISEWVDNNRLETPAADGSLYDRPFLVWAHHTEVVEAIKAGINASEVKTSVAIIDGSVSVSKRGDIVDDFQAGKVGVLIASITAAGVGITLTRGSDMLFVETDWTPARVSQAEDRQLRIGQTQPVICETLIAAGTLDERIQSVLQTKALTLNAVLGGDEADVAVLDANADTITPSEIVINLLGMAKAKAKKELGLT